MSSNIDVEEAQRELQKAKENYQKTLKNLYLYVGKKIVQEFDINSADRFDQTILPALKNEPRSQDVSVSSRENEDKQEVGDGEQKNKSKANINEDESDKNEQKIDKGNSSKNTGKQSNNQPRENQEDPSDSSSNEKLFQRQSDKAVSDDSDKNFSFKNLFGDDK